MKWITIILCLLPGFVLGQVNLSNQHVPRLGTWSTSSNARWGYDTTKHYFDQVNGNDSWEAHTPAFPKKTISELNNLIKDPGDSVLCNKGDTWTGASIVIGTAGTSGNNITIGSYGTGAKPIIEYNSGTPILVNAADRGYWTIDNLDLRSTDVNVLGGVLGISTDYWDGDDPGETPGWIIKNCEFNCGIFFAGPDVLISNNNFDGTGSGSDANVAIYIRGPAGHDAIIEYNTIDEYYGRGIWIMRGVDDVIVRYNTITNIHFDGDAGHGINNDGFSAANDAMIVYGNTVGNCDRIGINGENAFNAEYYNNYIDSCDWYGINIFMYDPYLGDITNTEIHHNIIYNCNSGFLSFDAAGYLFANNTIYKDNATGSERFGYFITGADADYSHDITCVNNIFDGDEWIHVFRTSQNTDLYTDVFTAFDYNDIVPVGTEVVYDGFIGSITLATLQANSLMTDGITDDPLLVNPGTDFSLDTGSPAINTGVDVGLTEDFYGNPIVGLPDMGAIEKQ